MIEWLKYTPSNILFTQYIKVSFTSNIRHYSFITVMNFIFVFFIDVRMPAELSQTE